MAGAKYLTLICVLKTGEHIIHQTLDTLPGHTGVRIGGHIALRQRELGEDLATVVIVYGASVTEHRP